MANENVVIDLLGTPHTNGVVSCAYDQTTNELTCTYADDSTQTVQLNDKHVTDVSLSGSDLIITMNTGTVFTTSLDTLDVATIQSALFNNSTNIATFTRSDASTMELDLSDLQETETFLTKISDTLVYDGEVGASQIIDLSEYNHTGLYIPIAEKAVADGVATLDGDSTLEVAQIPPEAINVDEYVNLASFPAIGLSKVIYIDVATSLLYRWGDMKYVPLSLTGLDPIIETGSATYTPDFSASNYFEYTLNQDADIVVPLNTDLGQRGDIVVRQDAAGTWTPTFGINYIFPSGAPTVNTDANAYNMFKYTVIATDRILLEFVADFV